MLCRLAVLLLSLLLFFADLLFQFLLLLHQNACREQIGGDETTMDSVSYVFVFVQIEWDCIWVQSKRYVEGRRVIVRHHVCLPLRWCPTAEGRRRIEANKNRIA